MADTKRGSSDGFSTSDILKWYYDENRIFPIETILKYKQVACMRRKMLFTIFKYLFSFHRYCIYSNKRRGAYLIFRATSAAVIRGRRLFKNCNRRIYFFYIFIQQYTFCLLILLWVFFLVIRNSSNKPRIGDAALIRGRRL